jgi:hypothetical protein
MDMLMSTSILFFKTAHLFFVEDRFCGAKWALDTLNFFVDALLLFR